MVGIILLSRGSRCWREARVSWIVGAFVPPHFQTIDTVGLGPVPLCRHRRRSAWQQNNKRQINIQIAPPIWPIYTIASRREQIPLQGRSVSRSWPWNRYPSTSGLIPYRAPLLSHPLHRINNILGGRYRSLQRFLPPVSNTAAFLPECCRFYLFCGLALDWYWWSFYCGKGENTSLYLSFSPPSGNTLK